MNSIDHTQLSNSVQPTMAASEQQFLEPLQTTTVLEFKHGRKRKQSPTSVSQGSITQQPQEGHFAQSPKRRPVFIEIFGGTGNSLSKWMYHQGFDVVCIDHKGNKHTPKFSSIDIDLTTDSGQPLLWHLIHTLEPEAIHAGVPCGTSSRAREREISSDLKARGAPQPPPLRDYDHPMGKHLQPTEDLSGEQALRASLQADHLLPWLGHRVLSGEPMEVMGLGGFGSSCSTRIVSCLQDNQQSANRAFRQLLPWSYAKETLTN